MILVGSQRSGAAALADHLMNDRENDHVELIEQTGFMAENLHGALQEAHAISKATRCKQFLFSCSLNPPEGVVVTDAGFKDAAIRVAEKLGLSDHPCSVVVHEKNGRRHAHVVFSRINDPLVANTRDTTPPLEFGGFVSVVLETMPPQGMIAIPRDILQQSDDGQPFVYTADAEDRLAVTPVTPGPIAGDRILITDGLDRGARVLLSAPRPSIPGLALEVVTTGVATP